MHKDRWRLSALVFLSAIASPSAPASGSPTEQAAPGAAAFARVCAACHGTSGEGDKGPPIVPLVYAEPEVTVIVRGGQGQMPPIPKAALTDDELAAIVAYLGGLGENS